VKQIKKRLTYANVMSSIAVFLVLGGAAVAATQLPKNSVGTKQLKKEAVSLAKIKKGAKNALQGAAGPAGPAGPQGPKGDTGAAGTALGFARVESNGVVDASKSKNVTSANVTHPETGAYCFSGLGFTPLNAVATPQFFNPQPSMIHTFIGDFEACPPGTQVSVVIKSEGNTLRNVPFMILFN
jgi:hypothetical protein